MSNRKSFFRIGIIYTIGQLMFKAISFIMIPIYTRELGIVGFGQLSLVDTVLNFLSTFLIISIFSGYIRFYRDYKEKDRKRLKNTAINFAIIISIFDLVFVFSFGRIIGPILFNFNNSYEILILIILRGIVEQFVTLLSCDYNLNYKAHIIIIINFFMMVLNVLFIMYFLLFKCEGVLGIYKGYFFGTLIVVISLFFIQIKNYKFEFDKKMFKRMFKFSFGLMPCGISATILDLADRYILAGYKGFAQTGIYSMGYKIGTLIDPVFISPFKSIFTTYKFEIWKDNDNNEKFNEMYKNYHIIGNFIMLSIAFCSPILILILSDKTYLLAVNLIPIILFSYYINGKNEFFSVGIQLKNKTYLTSIIMLAGGISNIIINLILIPIFGMYGAAVSTLISYYIINFINMSFSNKLHGIRYDLKLGYKIDLISICVYISFMIFSKDINNILILICISIIFLVIYIFILILIKVLTIDEIKIYIKNNLKFN
ncbi:oligosaccharide flippase family protein [Clostridium perfringens]|uniref:oligosaccharide flippase family protein n=2 Tax=Clostridium perfringens TaxID=1502 RepID=UPI0034A19C0C